MDGNHARVADSRTSESLTGLLSGPRAGSLFTQGDWLSDLQAYRAHMCLAAPEVLWPNANRRRAAFTTPIEAIGMYGKYASQ